MCKNMEETHHSIPKTTVSETLLVSDTRTLNQEPAWAHWYARVLAGGAECKRMSEGRLGLTDLYVLSERVEDLFGYFHGFREVLLPVGVNYILSWVVPVEVTDRLLKWRADKIHCRWVWDSQRYKKRGQTPPKKWSGALLVSAYLHS